MLNLVKIPAGVFERDEQRYEIKPFLMGAYPITNLEYERYDPTHERRAELDADNQPVINVSWDDANHYCQWLTEQNRKDRAYRLPGEAEWEYACRAGGEGEYCLGADGREVTTENLADYAVFSAGKTAPVGSKKPNAFGLYDMHGNVWEWCGDRYIHDIRFRMLRGGSWYSSPFGMLSLLSAGRRYCHVSASKDNTIGFRVVAYPKNKVVTYPPLRAEIGHNVGHS